LGVVTSLVAECIAVPATIVAHPYRIWQRDYVQPLSLKVRLTPPMVEPRLAVAGQIRLLDDYAEMPITADQYRVGLATRSVRLSTKWWIIYLGQLCLL
jgi:hypothetical protein